MTMKEWFDRWNAFLGLCFIIAVVGGIGYILLYALGIALKTVSAGYHS